MELVTAACIGLRWDPNGVVEPELTVTDGSARLCLGAHPDDAALTHWVVLLKEETVEVVARGLEVTRE